MNAPRLKRILLSRWTAALLLLAGLVGMAIGIIAWIDLTPKIARYSPSGCEATLQKLFDGPVRERVVHDVSFTSKDDISFTYSGALRVRSKQIQISSRAEAEDLKASIDRTYENAERLRLRELDRTRGRARKRLSARWDANAPLEHESDQIRQVLTHARMHTDFRQERMLTMLVGLAGLLLLAGGVVSIRAGARARLARVTADTTLAPAGATGRRSKLRSWVGVLVTLLGLPFFFGWAGAAIYGHQRLHKYSPPQLAGRLADHGDQRVLKDISFTDKSDIALTYTGILSRWRGRRLGAQEVSALREALQQCRFDVKRMDYRAKLDADIVRDLDAWAKTQRDDGTTRDSRTLIVEKVTIEARQVSDVCFAAYIAEEYSGFVPRAWMMCAGGLLVSAVGVIILRTGRRFPVLESDAEAAVAGVVDPAEPVDAPAQSQPAPPPGKAAACLATGGLVVMVLALGIGAFVCFLVACEWSRGATQMGGAPREPGDLAAAVLALAVGGSLLLMLASAVFPFRGWRRRRRASGGEARLLSWRFCGTTLLVFFALSALMSIGFAAAMGHVKAEATKKVESGLGHFDGRAYRVDAKGRFKARVEAMEAERVQYRAVTTLCIAAAGLLGLAAIHAIRSRKRRDADFEASPPAPSD